MSHIVRPVKSGSGTTEYVPNTVILSAEVNADLDTIYDDYNGNITDFNISPSANIDPTKLNRATPWVGTADIVNNAVTSGKLAVGATYTNNVVASAPANTVFPAAAATLFDTPTFVSRGSVVLLMGCLNLQCTLERSASPFGDSNPLDINIYVATPGPIFTLLTTFSLNAGILAMTANDTVIFPVSQPFSVIDSPTSIGTTYFYRVQVIATVDNASPVNQWQTTGNPGFLSVLQLS